MFRFLFTSLLIYVWIFSLSAQELSYSFLTLSPETFKSYLFSNSDYFSSGNANNPHFQKKNGKLNIKFYETTNIYANLDFQSTSDFLNLVREVQSKAYFEHKFCSSYDEPVIFKYITSNKNIIRFNFSEIRVQIQYPSKLDNIFEGDFELIMTVFVCLSENAYAFHTNLKCEGLGNCNSKIAKTNISEAKKYGYRICEICSNDSYSKRILKDIYQENSTSSTFITDLSKTDDLPNEKKINNVTASDYDISFSSAEKIITAFLAAEESRDIYKILEFYSITPKRYYRWHYPTKEDVKNQYFLAWDKTSKSINNIKSIIKVSNNVYDLETEFVFTDKKGNKKSIDSIVRFVFDEDFKIIEVYNH
ncbi:MAG: hypothetical protein R2821_03865 [Flavobacteriaceae bacterium]